MKQFYEKLASKKFFGFLLNSSGWGGVVLKSIGMLAASYIWMFVWSAVFGGLFIVPEMAPVILITSALILIFAIVLIVGAFSLHARKK